MQASHPIQGLTREKVDPSLLPGILLMVLALVIAIFVAIAVNDPFSSFPYLFLLPWIFGLAVVMLTPSIILYYKGRFSFADPLIFATWSYFFPAFVIGGIVLAAGWSDPYYLSFVQDAEYNLPYTVVLIGLGFVGMSVGYLCPVGSVIGRRIEKYLPTLNEEGLSFLPAGMLLLGLGFMNSIIAFALGIIGYQNAEAVTSYDGLIYLTTLFWIQGSFLLCYTLFRQRQWKTAFVPVIALLATTSAVKIIFSGNRGSIIQIFAVVALAYILSGRRFHLKQGLFAGTILTIGIIAGMIYGTTFRNTKGSEAQVSLGSYAENVSSTFDQLGSNVNVSALEFGLIGLAARVDAVSAVAVVVSNYEQLQPYEESYGLDNNIWKDTTTFFIPRVAWEDKPLASEPRQYGNLYFDYGENSFTITPIGDLLRNFGVPGVFLGMVILGVILRVIYRSLVEDQKPETWKMMLYFMLLTCVNYESFYAAIMPALFKVGAVSIVGILIVYVVAGSTGGRPVQE
jgi:hypothetical protein